MGSTIQKNTELVKSIARKLGFSFCGISKADQLQEEAKKLEAWLNSGKHGKMTYMENHFDMRIDPRKLVPEAKSVISLLYNYYADDSPLNQVAPKISKYAWGVDYHSVIKEKLFELFSEIKTAIGSIEGRVFVDSAPVMDKVWAKKGGLGWIGKNTNLIHKNAGSYFFIAEIILDLDLLYDGPIKDYCGTCTRCIDACPTEAIVAPYIVDGSKCISYFTIELKEEIPAVWKGKFDDWSFGCDVCQQVCPWNRFSKPHQEPLFKPSVELEALEKREWLDMTEDTFKKVFGKSAIKRTGYKGLKRNLTFNED
jgi:epoxyqueuosine reductase